MSWSKHVQKTWNSYWFRLLTTGVPVGVLVGLVTWFSNVAELGSIGYVVLMFTVLIGYGFLLEERYIKPWRRETVNGIN